MDTLTDEINPKGKEKLQRCRPSIRTGCYVYIKLQTCDDKSFMVYSFLEEHNHPFVDAQDYHLLSSARKLTYDQEWFMYSLFKLNIRLVKAFNIMRIHCGGFDEICVTSVDFKNFKRDINVFVGMYDPEMVVRRLMRNKEYLPDYSCEYRTNDKGELIGLVWADSEMKHNY